MSKRVLILIVVADLVVLLGIVAYFVWQQSVFQPIVKNPLTGEEAYGSKRFTLAEGKNSWTVEVRSEDPLESFEGSITASDPSSVSINPATFKVSASNKVVTVKLTRNKSVSSIITARVSGNGKAAEFEMPAK